MKMHEDGKEGEKNGAARSIDENCSKKFERTRVRILCQVVPTKNRFFI